MKENNIKEIWKDCSYSKNYIVSNRGTVRAKFRGIISGAKTYFRSAHTLSPGKDKNGYFFVRLSHNNNIKQFYIHQLVAEAFIGPCPENRTVDHINRIKTDNRIENLRYATIKQQNDNRILNPAKGSKCNFSKLNENQVKEIRELYTDSNSINSLAKKYEVNRSTISKIINYQTWKHI